MADVEKMTATAPTDIPVSSPNVSETGGASSSTAELGTSPTQEPSSNSHPHDSEYDTASDLEGGEDYEDESSSEEETETDDDGSETDEEGDELGSGTVSGNGMDRNAADNEAQKKVDEDRSNPQYIPKRGTFYEHDDRTAETEGDGVVDTASDSGQCIVEPSISDVGNGVITTGATPAGHTPTISQASKTMKKWQPASGGDRWSHDRFEANEQAPKTRAELLQTYGYDIRNEDAAPRARRRRRYGRGPSKYSRNWEDEQAYLKASNKERKPPRPQDFPALNERSSTSNISKVHGPRTSISRDEKENRGERRSLPVATRSSMEALRAQEVFLCHRSPWNPVIVMLKIAITEGLMVVQIADQVVKMPWSLNRNQIGLHILVASIEITLINERRGIIIRNQ